MRPCHQQCTIGYAGRLPEITWSRARFTVIRDLNWTVRPEINSVDTMLSGDERPDEQP